MPYLETQIRIEHYSQIYYCDVASFCVMGNHYHLVARFDQFIELDELDNDDFCDRIRKLYPNTFEQAHQWSKEQYERLNRRLFDVSEFMRQVQSAYTRWYNREFKRSGTLWADRFKSTVLANEESVQNAMLYVDLNPVRAGLVSCPEDYRYCSLHYREMKKDKSLIPLPAVFFEASTVVYRYYKARVYYRGEVPTKENQGRIRETILAEAEVNAFARKGVLRKRLRHFTEGLITRFSPFFF